MAKPLGPTPGKRLVRRSATDVTKPIYTASEPPQAPPAKTTKLDPGDEVEFGTTIEIEAGGTKIWLRGAATGHVRPDENGSMAWSRVANFVQSQIDKQAREYQ